MSSQIRTIILLAALSAIILLLGRAIGGQAGLLVALALALVMNLGSYWFSDKIVLSAYKANPLAESQSPMLHSMVAELAAEAGVPKPRLYLVPDDSPNAFATGRNPEHAALAVTKGLMVTLSPEEIRGVLAHEVGHIKNRDILIQSVAGVLATCIMYLAHMVQWAAIFGVGRSRDERGPGGSILGGILLAVLAPLAAGLVQMALSRSREYLADATGAEISKSPLSLASALDKISRAGKALPMHEQDMGTAHMLIVNPAVGGLSGLFSTHPPVEERIRRLQAMDRDMRSRGPRTIPA